MYICIKECRLNTCVFHLLWGNNEHMRTARLQAYVVGD